MKILITGATGFIGSSLLSSWAADHELVCLVRDRKRLAKEVRASAIETDLEDFPLHSKLPKRCDAIIHLAQAQASFPEDANPMFAVNSASTQQLAAYAAKAGVQQFVYASSGNVYWPRRSSLQESSRLHPASFYALTKIISEQVLELYRRYFNVCILRLFAPYGPGQTGRMIPRIIELVRHHHPVVLVNGGQPRVNPVHIDDLLLIFKRAMRLSGFEIVNVAGPKIIGIKDIAEIAGSWFGRKPSFKNISQRASANLIADTKKMHRLFPSGSMVDPIDGIKSMLKAGMRQGDPDR